MYNFSLESTDVGNTLHIPAPGIRRNYLWIDF